MPQFIGAASTNKVGAFLVLGLTFVTLGVIWCVVLAVAAASLRGAVPAPPVDGDHAQQGRRRHVHRARPEARDRAPVNALSSRRPATSGRKRLILPSAHRTHRHGLCRTRDAQLFEENQRGAVFMMGDNPALPRMPEKPTLLDFYLLRFGTIARRHHCLSAKLALEAGHDEKVVIACFLHDIANGALMRTDHGYWGAQLIAPYVSEEIAWAVQLPPAAALLRRRVGRLRVPGSLQALLRRGLRAAGIHPKGPRRGARRTAGT